MQSVSWQWKTTAVGRRKESVKNKKVLQLTEIKEIVSKPKHRQQIATAVAHESRISLHAEATIGDKRYNRAVTQFLDWVKTQLPSDKYRIFVSLFRYPVKTVAFTETIFESLQRVLDGKNPVFTEDFVSPELLDNWEEYKKDQLKDPKRFQYEAFEAMKTQINGVVVVDLPENQAGARPEPYSYVLDIKNVVDYSDLDDEGEFDWIIFKPAENRLSVFDREGFQLFETDPGATSPKKQISAVNHGLGRCPAKFLWYKPVNRREKSIKQSPLTNQLSNLDWLLYYMIAKRQVDNYAPFPIFWGFEADCDYENTETRDYCDGGFLKDANGHYLMNGDGSIQECPVCSKKKLTGAGSFIEVPAPGPQNDGANLRDPIGIVTVDKSSLEYIVEEIDRLKVEIFENVTGYGGEPINDQAINEKQVFASFESKAQALRNLKSQFEKAHEWRNWMICKLRYGNSFIGNSYSYGTEFYLMTPDQLLDWYEKARNKGLNDSILDMIEDEYNKTKYRNNPNELHRVNILKNLDPFRHLTKGDVREMYRNDGLPFEDYFLKVNFSSLIQRFERENISVTQFGEALEFDKKIEAIKNELLRYGSEYKTTTSQENTGSSQAQVPA